jgi:predicted nuclease of predicted toxin-antitoxin system
MALRAKLDEDLSPLTGEPLQAAGYEVSSVAGQGWSGLKDAELWKRVCTERILFITADKGFGDARTYPPGTHGGVVLLRPDRESVLGYRRLLQIVVANYRLELLVGNITVVTARGIRIRRPATLGQ